jgi:hypothetical protein
MVLGVDMNIENIGAIGGLVAAIATLTTLIYLTIQVRQNSQSLKAASHHAVTDSFNQINTIIATDLGAARVFRLGLLGIENLTEDEQFSFAFLMLGYLQIFETLFYQCDIGATDITLLESEKSSLNWAFAYSGARVWWRSNSISFGPNFRNYIDKIVDSHERSD